MPSLTVKTRDQIRDDILRTLSNGLKRRGVTTPNVSFGSDYYCLATAIANELVVAEANTQVAADAQMPDTAAGADLDRVCAIYGFTRRGAIGARGVVTIVTSVPAPIVAGSQLVDSSGQRFTVDVTGTYANGSSVPITAISTGASTNHAPGDILQWLNAPAYVDTRATVGLGGLTRGSAAEDDGTLRNRLYAYLQNPPGSGKWSQIAKFAEDSSPLVQKAFVYPAILGPSTVHVTVVGYPSTTNPNRDIDSVTLNNIIAPYVAGQLPEYVELAVSTVANLPTDLSFKLALPAATTASPPGIGGGWLDGSPWPQPGTSLLCDVTAVTSSTVFTVNANAPPIPGFSRIACYTPSSFTLKMATVVSFTGSGPYTVTVDTPIVGIAVGNYVMPQALRLQAYFDALRAYFSTMGPGEKTTNVSVIGRAYRRPQPAASWPSRVDARMLKAIINAGPEVSDATLGYFSRTVPTVAPIARILTPNNIAFYPT